jgi:hypothetical protein
MRELYRDKGPPIKDLNKPTIMELKQYNYRGFIERLEHPSSAKLKATVLK